MTTPPRSKAELRAAMRRRLAALAPGERAAAAVRVAARTRVLPAVAAANRVLCCLSFGDELDTRSLIADLLAAGHEVCIPRCVEGSRALTLHAYPCALEKVPFGLEQPRADVARIAPEEIDVALLLGLAFDARGYRLGHGGGYFDRFLAAHPLPAVGLAYDFQRLDRLPAAAHDVALATVVTESATWAATG